MRFIGRSVALLSLVVVAGCDMSVNRDAGSEASAETVSNAQKQEPPQPRLSPVAEQARRELNDLRFVVDVSDRKLRVMQGNRLVRENDVAVGTAKWPTPTGSWNIHRVDINPEWNPPKDEEWAEEREPKAPGAPDNPMGKARLVYRMPNTIHGTKDLASLGKAASHGSIRVANDVVVQLAEMLLRAGGAWEGPEWFQQMAGNQSKEYQIKLQHPVPILVQD